MIIYDIVLVVIEMEISQFEFKKNFGQNFLKDKNIIEKIVNSVGIKDNSLVIEIGPGAGALTKELSVISKQVLAYEIDCRLEEVLDKNLMHCNNVDIIYDDFLNRSVKEDIKKYQYQHLYVVSNLPYYITTPIITKLIEEELKVEKVVVMVQKEVGDRFSAKPGSKDYNSLTVFLNYYFEVNKLFVVNRNSFIPKPNVDSIVVSLTSKTNLLHVKNESHFFKLVRDSFKYKRKTLKNNLKNYDLKKVEKVLNEYNMTLTTRAEQLPLEVFVKISNCLS